MRLNYVGSESEDLVEWENVNRFTACRSDQGERMREIRLRISFKRLTTRLLMHCKCGDGYANKQWLYQQSYKASIGMRKAHQRKRLQKISFNISMCVRNDTISARLIGACEAVHRYRKEETWGQNHSLSINALDHCVYNHKRAESYFISFRRVVINAIFRYFRSILRVYVDGHMDRMACTPHILHLCRTLLRHS
jgi:hypothetical protein